jgi:hypothetical protein
MTSFSLEEVSEKYYQAQLEEVGLSQTLIVPARKTIET